MSVLDETEAIVLSSKNWGDADKMVMLFTAKYGLLKTAAFGVRRPRSALAAPMQLFSYINVRLSSSNGRLYTVRNASLKRRYKKLTEDLEVMAYGALTTDYLCAFLPEGEPEIYTFKDLLAIFAALEVRNPRVTAIIGLYQLMEHTGMQLHFDHCAECGGKIVSDAFFNENVGGAVCAKCATKGLMPFNKDLQELVVAMRDFDWQKDKLTIKTDLFLQAEKLILTYIHNLLGRPLRSFKFIQELNKKM